MFSGATSQLNDVYAPRSFVKLRSFVNKFARNAAASGLSLTGAGTW